MPTKKQTTGPIALFLDYLQTQRRLSEHTVMAYQRDLTKLEAFVDKRNELTLSTLSAKEARLFPAQLHAQGLSGRSIQRVLSAARSFYRFLMREGLAQNNPFNDVRAPKPEKKLPNTLNITLCLTYIVFSLIAT